MKLVFSSIFCAYLLRLYMKIDFVFYRFFLLLIYTTGLIGYLFSCVGSYVLFPVYTVTVLNNHYVFFVLQFVYLLRLELNLFGRNPYRHTLECWILIKQLSDESFRLAGAFR